jgi:hypothetical protein
MLRATAFSGPTTRGIPGADLVPRPTSLAYSNRHFNSFLGQKKVFRFRVRVIKGASMSIFAVRHQGSNVQLGV